MEKLVRDLIPEIMKAKGQSGKFRIAKAGEYEIFLYKKLLEEVNEFIGNPSIEELADLMEVIKAIKHIRKISFEKLEGVRRIKYLERGGFEKKLIRDAKC